MQNFSNNAHLHSALWIQNILQTDNKTIPNMQTDLKLIQC